MALPHLRSALVTLTWFPVVYVALDHVYLPCQISGSSMAPIFNPATDSVMKDVVLLKKYGVRSPGSLARGDIVMFRSPTDPERLLTKRVVGTQGDTIFPRDPNYPRKEILVPRNHLWVEGDNEFHLVDLNKFGPISQALVVGKVEGIIWPLNRWGAKLEGGRNARKRILPSL